MFLCCCFIIISKWYQKFSKICCVMLNLVFWGMFFYLTVGSWRYWKCFLMIWMLSVSMCTVRESKASNNFLKSLLQKQQNGDGEGTIWVLWEKPKGFKIQFAISWIFMGGGQFLTGCCTLIQKLVVFYNL